jgi:hypothetical protein
MHLTNYSINKTSEDYVKPSELEGKNEDIMADNDGTKRTLTSLYDTLSKKGVDVGLIKENISDTCARIMQVYGPMIEHQVKSYN